MAARVLIAEDDGANRQLLGRSLRGRGLEVTLVENGQQAIDAMERELPAAVVLDLMMPVKDGFSVLERLRALPAAPTSASWCSPPRRWRLKTSTGWTAPGPRSRSRERSLLNSS